MATSPDGDPRNWRLSVSEGHLALYSELGNEPRELTPSEATMMVELVDAWRDHEHRKHIALMGAGDSAVAEASPSIAELKVWMRQRVMEVLQRPGMYAAGAHAMSTLWRVLLDDLGYVDNREDEVRGTERALQQRYGSTGISALDEWFADCWGRPSAEAASCWAEIAFRLGYVRVERELDDDEWMAAGLQSASTWIGRSLSKSVLAEQHPPSLRVDKDVFCYVNRGTRDWAFVDFDGSPPFEAERFVRDIRLPAVPARDGLFFL